MTTPKKESRELSTFDEIHSAIVALCMYVESLDLKTYIKSLELAALATDKSVDHVKYSLKVGHAIKRLQANLTEIRKSFVEEFPCMVSRIEIEIESRSQWLENLENDKDYEKYQV